MRVLLASLYTIGSITTVSVMLYEQHLNLVSRLEDGTVFAQIEHSHPQDYKVQKVRYDAPVYSHVGLVKCVGGKTEFCGKTSRR